MRHNNQVRIDIFEMLMPIKEGFSVYNQTFPQYTVVFVVKFGFCTFE